MRLRAIVCVGLISSLLAAVPFGSAVASPPRRERLALSGTERIARLQIPDQPNAAEARDAVDAAGTSGSRCVSGETETLVLTVPSFGLEPIEWKEVVFHLETPAASTSRARIWVAWDSLQSDWATDPDVITCDQVDFLEGAAGQIIDTDVHYFGDYSEHAIGGDKVDILTYDIVDEAFYDPNAESYIAGFYSRAFEEAFDRSIFVLDSYPWANGLGPDAPRPFDVESIFAHEFVHLIMFDHDADEVSWINEGLADLGMYLNGYGHDTFHVIYYLLFHRDSLTRWGSALEDYGAAYLFQLYLLENFGERSGDTWDNEWTRGMMDQPADGIAGVEAQTDADFRDLYDAWIMANLQDTPEVAGAGGFPMGYDQIDLNPFHTRYGDFSIRRGIREIYGARSAGNLPISRYYGGYLSGTVEYPLGTLEPYSPLYRTLVGAQPGIDVFLRGDSESGVVPTDGAYEAYSGTGDLLMGRRMSLDAPVSGGSTLTFKAWWDIEEEWDYGFVEASTDGGETWAPIPGSITRTSTNPNDSAAWAFALADATSTDAAITGSSDGWVDASFELPAGDEVLIRFAYYTDQFYNGVGWFIDEVAVKDFSDSFEGDLSAWDFGGWEVGSLLFDNAWVVGYANPTRSGWQTGYVEGSGGYEGLEGYDLARTFLPALSLRGQEMVVVIANRPSDEDAFAAGSLLLLRKRP